MPKGIVGPPADDVAHVPRRSLGQFGKDTFHPSLVLIGSLRRLHRVARDQPLLHEGTPLGRNAGDKLAPCNVVLRPSYSRSEVPNDQVRRRRRRRPPPRERGGRGLRRAQAPSTDAPSLANALGS